MTIPRGNVTERDIPRERERERERDRERERERYAQIDYHKEFWALGGTLPNDKEEVGTLPKDENCCAWALGGSVSLRFAGFDSNCFEGCSCKN